MFKNQPINEKDIETVIGPSVKAKGNFDTAGSIQIEGYLEGTLKIGNDLIVGEKAEIIANLRANRIMIAGKVKGNIKARESLEITETARIDGDVETKILSVDAGATINGKIKMETDGNSFVAKKEKKTLEEEAKKQV